MVANQVRRGNALFAAWYSIRPPLRPNFASDSALRLMGPAFGWEMAERVWISLIILLQMLVYFPLLRTGLSVEAAAAASAWLASNWFTWMGFYDFSLSLAAFAALASVLRRRSGTFWGVVRIEALLLVLYATHLYTFLFGTALFIWILFWRVVHGRRPVELIAAAAPGGLMVYELLFGSAGHGGFSWSGWKGLGKAVIGWGIGDSVITFTWFGALVGTAIMVATWAGILKRIGRSRRSGRWDPMDLFAIGACIISCAVPNQIGHGSYTSARLRFITVLLLLPSTMAFLSHVRWPRMRSWGGLLSAGLALGLALQAGRIVWVSNGVGKQVDGIERTLQAAGVGKGEWVTSVLTNQDDMALHMSPYKHLPERAYLRLGVADLDDYEPEAGTFELSWRRHPRMLRFTKSDRRWLVAEEATGVSGIAVSVLHDTDLPLISRDPSLRIGPSVSRGPFTVTKIEQASYN